MYEQKSISNSNNFVVYFRYSLSFLYFLVYAYFVYWTSDSIVLASSTVAITMSVRKSDLVRSTSVWSLRPNEIFHRPSQHTSSVFVLWRRRNISLRHKDAPLRKVVWYRRRIHNFCNWKRSFRILFPLYARNVPPTHRDLALHPRHYRLFSRGQMKTRVLYTSSLRDVHLWIIIEEYIFDNILINFR